MFVTTWNHEHGFGVSCFSLFQPQGWVILYFSNIFRSMSYSDNKGNILPQTVLEALMEKLHLKHGVYHTIRKILTYFFLLVGKKLGLLTSNTCGKWLLKIDTWRNPFGWGLEELSNVSCRELLLSLRLCEWRGRGRHCSSSTASAC